MSFFFPFSPSKLSATAKVAPKVALFERSGNNNSANNSSNKSRYRKLSSATTVTPTTSQTTPTTPPPPLSQQQHAAAVVTPSVVVTPPSEEPSRRQQQQLPNPHHNHHRNHHHENSINNSSVHAYQEQKKQQLSSVVSNLQQQVRDLQTSLDYSSNSTLGGDGSSTCLRTVDDVDDDEEHWHGQNELQCRLLRIQQGLLEIEAERQGLVSMAGRLQDEQQLLRTEVSKLRETNLELANKVQQRRRIEWRTTTTRQQQQDDENVLLMRRDFAAVTETLQKLIVEKQTWEEERHQLVKVTFQKLQQQRDNAVHELALRLERQQVMFERQRQLEQKLELRQSKICSLQLSLEQQSNKTKQCCDACCVSSSTGTSSSRVVEQHQQQQTLGLEASAASRDDDTRLPEQSLPQQETNKTNRGIVPRQRGATVTVSPATPPSSRSSSRVEQLERGCLSSSEDDKIRLLEQSVDESHNGLLSRDDMRKKSQDDRELTAACIGSSSAILELENGIRTRDETIRQLETTLEEMTTTTTEVVNKVRLQQQQVYSNSSEYADKLQKELASRDERILLLEASLYEKSTEHETLKQQQQQQQRSSSETRQAGGGDDDHHQHHQWGIRHMNKVKRDYEDLLHRVGAQLIDREQMVVALQHELGDTMEKLMVATQTLAGAEEDRALCQGLMEDVSTLEQERYALLETLHERDTEIAELSAEVLKLEIGNEFAIYSSSFASNTETSSFTKDGSKGGSLKHGHCATISEQTSESSSSAVVAEVKEQANSSPSAADNDVIVSLLREQLWQSNERVRILEKQQLARRSDDKGNQDSLLNTHSLTNLLNQEIANLKAREQHLQWHIEKEVASHTNALDEKDKTIFSLRQSLQEKKKSETEMRRSHNELVQELQTVVSLRDEDDATEQVTQLKLKLKAKDLELVHCSRKYKTKVEELESKLQNRDLRDTERSLESQDLVNELTLTIIDLKQLVKKKETTIRNQEQQLQQHVQAQQQQQQQQAIASQKVCSLDQQEQKASSNGIPLHSEYTQPPRVRTEETKQTGGSGVPQELPTQRCYSEQADVDAAVLERNDAASLHEQPHLLVALEKCLYKRTTLLNESVADESKREQRNESLALVHQLAAGDEGALLDQEERDDWSNNQNVDYSLVRGGVKTEQKRRETAESDHAEAAVSSNHPTNNAMPVQSNNPARKNVASCIADFEARKGYQHESPSPSTRMTRQPPNERIAGDVVTSRFMLRGLTWTRAARAHSVSASSERIIDDSNSKT